MNLNPAQSEIVGLERKYWSAMKNNDADIAVGMTKFPCILSTPKGMQRVEENEYRQMMKSMKGTDLNDTEIENPEVDMLTDSAALISYSIKHKGKRMLDTSTWIRDNGRWCCAVHTESLLN